MPSQAQRAQIRERIFGPCWPMLAVNTKPSVNRTVLSMVLPATHIASSKMGDDDATRREIRVDRPQSLRNEFVRGTVESVRRMPASSCEPVAAVHGTVADPPCLCRAIGAPLLHPSFV